MHRFTDASSSEFRSKPRIESYLEEAREVVEELDAQTEEECSRQVQGARTRARRERQERLESAMQQRPIGANQYQRRGVSPEYESSKFVYDEETKTFFCPQGKRLKYDAKYEQNGTIHYRYKASDQDCQTCSAKASCCARNRHGRSVDRLEPLPEIAAFQQKIRTGIVPEF